MKVLMVDVDGVLVHGRPADGLPYATYLERDLAHPALAPVKAWYDAHVPGDYRAPFWEKHGR